MLDLGFKALISTTLPPQRTLYLHFFIIEFIQFSQISHLFILLDLDFEFRENGDRFLFNFTNLTVSWCSTKCLLILIESPTPTFFRLAKITSSLFCSPCFYKLEDNCNSILHICSRDHSELLQTAGMESRASFSQSIILKYCLWFYYHYLLFRGLRTLHLHETGCVWRTKGCLKERHFQSTNINLVSWTQLAETGDVFNY